MVWYLLHQKSEKCMYCRCSSVTWNFLGDADTPVLLLRTCRFANRANAHMAEKQKSSQGCDKSITVNPSVAMSRGQFYYTQKRLTVKEPTHSPRILVVPWLWASCSLLSRIVLDLYLFLVCLDSLVTYHVGSTCTIWSSSQCIERKRGSRRQEWCGLVWILLLLLLLFYTTRSNAVWPTRGHWLCHWFSAPFAVVIAAIGIPLLLLVAALILFCRHNPDDDSPTDNNEASDGATVSIEKDLEEGQDDYDDDNIGGRPQETNIQIDRTSTYLSFESSSSEGTTVL